MTDDFGIIGGGIVGLAVGRELALRHPGARIVVFEAEDQLGAHQTGHNSGVVHAGIYYKPGSLKAELCTLGRSLLREYCAERSLPYEECGKLVVAVDAGEMGRFDKLEATARENGVPGLRRVDGSGVAEVEPHATGLAALHSPVTAITDFVAVAKAYAADIEAAGGRIHLSTPVTGVTRRADGIEVATPGQTHRVDRLVICAGLQADRMSRLADGVDGPRIVPFRGEYMLVNTAKRDLVRGMVYPVPDPRYPFLGVHYTRRVYGDLEVGPNAGLALDRNQYRRLAGLLADGSSALEDRRDRDAGLALGARVYEGGGPLRAGARPWRCRPGPRRAARPGRRPRRLAGRRLPDQPQRFDHQHPQRPVSRCHLVAGHRPLRGRPDEDHLLRAARQH